MALVRDPWFWNRFSRAVHMDEEKNAPDEEKQPSVPPNANLFSFYSQYMLIVILQR